MTKEKYQKQLERGFVSFEYVPDPRSEEFVPHSTRKLSPRPDGLGMDRLIQIVEESIPTAPYGSEIERREIRTDKSVVYASREECPCCPTRVHALVRVSVRGTRTPASEPVTEEEKSIEGYYEVSIGDRTVGGRLPGIKVTRLDSGEVIDCSAMEKHLPTRTSEGEVDKPEFTYRAISRRMRD